VIVRVSENPGYAASPRHSVCLLCKLETSPSTTTVAKTAVLVVGSSSVVKLCTIVMPERGNLHELYSASQLVSLGLKLYKQGKYSEALEALNSVRCELMRGLRDENLIFSRQKKHAMEVPTLISLILVLRRTPDWASRSRRLLMPDVCSYSTKHTCRYATALVSLCHELTSDRDIYGPEKSWSLWTRPTSR